MKDLDQLAVRVRNAIERANQSRSEWINASINAAVALFAARRRLPSNALFASWSREHDVDLSRDDRAALLQLGAHAEEARAILANGTTESWRSAAQRLRWRTQATSQRSSQTANMPSPLVRWKAEDEKIVRLVPAEENTGASLSNHSTEPPPDVRETSFKPKRPYEAGIVQALAQFRDALLDAPSSPDPIRTIETWSLTRGDRLTANELRNLASWLESAAEALEVMPRSQHQA